MPPDADVVDTLRTRSAALRDRVPVIDRLLIPTARALVALLWMGWTAGWSIVLALAGDGDYIDTSGTVVGLTALAIGGGVGLLIVRRRFFLRRATIALGIAGTIFLARGLHELSYIGPAGDGWHEWRDSAGRIIVFGDTHPQWIGFGAALVWGLVAAVVLDCVARVAVHARTRPT